MLGGRDCLHGQGLLVLELGFSLGNQEEDRVIWEEKSEHLLFKIVQESLFSEEIQELTQSGSVKTSSKLHRYNPFLDKEGILRVDGRWQQTTRDFEMKDPISLGCHYITQLLVRHYHKKHFHVGVDAIRSKM